MILKNMKILKYSTLILIIGTLIFSFKSIFFPTINNELINESNKAEKYWEDTELTIEHLKQYVTNNKCQENSKYFLSCINSLLFALDRTDFHLTTEGKIESNTEIDLDNLNEKQRLNKFLTLYALRENNNFNFDQLWTQTLNLSKSNYKKHLIAFGINGFLSINKDPHTYIGPTAYFNEVASKNEKSKYLFGVSLKKTNNNLIIIQIAKNSDADLAGLKVDDQIVSINNKSTQQMNVNDAVFMLKDSTKDSFTLKIIRKDKSLIKEIKRSYRTLSQVYGEILGTNQNIGYIQLSKFNFDVCDNVKKELQKLNPKTLKGLIFDLRDNPGGLLSEASCLGGLFIGENKRIFTAKYLNSLEEESLTTSDQIYTGPMVILINNRSASASELFAGAMQEYKRATVIGERSFGKGSFQEVTEWNRSSKISLYKTQGFYLLPSGESTQLKGVTPDLIVDRDSNEREKDIYQYPLSYPKNKISKVKSLSNKEFANSQKCLKSLQNKELSEDIILAKAQNFLDCILKK